MRALCAALQRQAAAAARSRPPLPGTSAAPALQLSLQRTTEAALRAAAALAAALALHLGGPEAAQASAAEDALLQLVRQVEAKVDGAVGAVRGAASLVSLGPHGAGRAAAASRTGTWSVASSRDSPATLHKAGLLHKPSEPAQHADPDARLPLHATGRGGQPGGCSSGAGAGGRGVRGG